MCAREVGGGVLCGELRRGGVCRFFVQLLVLGMQRGGEVEVEEVGGDARFGVWGDCSCSS